MFKNSYITLLLAFMMTGCTQSTEHIDYTTFRIWDTNSEKIEIVQNNGFVPPDTERIVRYTYTKAMLSDQSIQMLKETIAVGGGDTAEFYCMQDGVTYKLIVTDINNRVTSYRSSNLYCDKTADKKYITTTKVKQLIDLLAQ